MAQGFCIWIVTPPGYLHSRCFEEVALGLQEAFAALGYTAPIVTDAAQITGLPVVLGANLLPQLRPEASQRKMILYNLEQIQKHDSPWLGSPYIDLLRRHPVWDYSERNIKGLKELGVTDITLCGIGYMPGLTRIPSALQDIDVLFVGSTNDRRLAVLNDLAARGVKVSAAYNCYGEQRDALIARAKIVLNVHFYEAQVFEIVRVSYLLANRVCVVSESGFDETLESPLKDGVAFGPYAALTAICQHMLAHEDQRLAVAKNGFDKFSAISQVAMLERALKLTAPGAPIG